MNSLPTAIDLSGFAVAVGRLMPRLTRRMLVRERSALARGRLTVPQMSVLDHLAATGGCTMREIGTAFQIPPPMVTAIIDHLVAGGMARRGRAPRDRRAVQATITPRGRRVVASFHSERQRTIRDLFAGVSERDRRCFLRVLSRAVDSAAEGPPR